jgi:hypothetical protein
MPTLILTQKAVNPSLYYCTIKTDGSHIDKNEE